MLLDLSHPITPDMSLFPGTPPPEQRPLAAVETDGWRETALRLTSHTGTHLDAPAHVLPGGRTLDQFPLDAFCGSARTVDCTGQTAIGPDFLRAGLSEQRPDFVLLRTGWDRFWGTPDYLSGFPVLTEAGARFLAGLGLKGVGVDALSFDPADSAELPIHHILLGAGLLQLENLAGLDRLTGRAAELFLFPLPWPDADGGPVRAVARIEEKSTLSPK